MKLEKIYDGMAKAGEIIDKNLNTIVSEFQKTDTNWVDIPLLNGVSGNVKVRKINNQIFLNIYVVPKKAGTTDDCDIAKLPGNFRLTGLFTSGASFPISTNSITDLGTIHINSDGIIRVWKSPNIGARHYLNTCWLAD